MAIARTVPFAELPDHARLWVFAAARPLSPRESDLLLDRVDEFLNQWHAHGQPVVGARDLRLDQFLLVAADERATGVSGCSIDSLFRVLKEVEQALDVALLDSGRIHYRDDHSDVRSASRDEFRELVRSGAVDGETRVFDNTVSTVADVREERWERPARESWHGRAFRIG